MTTMTRPTATTPHPHLDPYDPLAIDSLLSDQERAVRDRVRSALEGAVRSLGVAGADLPDLELQRARNRQHGDYASGAGLKLAGLLKRPPPQIAKELAERIDIPEAVAEAALSRRPEPTKAAQLFRREFLCHENLKRITEVMVRRPHRRAGAERRRCGERGLTSGAQR